jgi:ribosomal protein S8
MRYNANVGLMFYPMPEISDFQRTHSEFAKSEQKYPVNISFRAKFIRQRALSPTRYISKKTNKIWPVESGDRAVVSGHGIKISDTTYV